MRIKKFDRLLTVYTVSSDTLDGEGYRSTIYTASTVPADIQPIGAKVDLSIYGINSNPAEVQKLFFDSGIAMPLGAIVEDGAGIRYMVKGLHVWYSHQEAILEPWSGTITLAGD